MTSKFGNKGENVPLSPLPVTHCRRLAKLIAAPGHYIVCGPAGCYPTESSTPYHSVSPPRHPPTFHVEELSNPLKRDVGIG